MSLETKIRAAVLAGEGDRIRELLLNAEQIKLVAMIAHRKSIRTHQLAAQLRISIANASQKLSRLHRAGYIARSSVSQESGGNEYVYRSNQ